MVDFHPEVRKLSMYSLPKRGHYNHYNIFFLFLKKNICCGYSLEVSQCGTSNECPKHIFSQRNKKNISTLRKKRMSYLVL